MKKKKTSRMSGMMKEFESSGYDKDSKSAPEGSKADKKNDAAQMKMFKKGAKK